MHEFDLINNFFFKIAKKNKSALNLNDDVFYDKKKGVIISDPEAREYVYGMPYSIWKEKYQK